LNPTKALNTPRPAEKRSMVQVLKMLEMIRVYNKRKPVKKNAVLNHM
jgi:hypothetical protein